jgi:hypothetical protein
VRIIETVPHLPILRALIWQIMAKRPELASLVSPYFKSPERIEALLASPGTLLEIFIKLANDPAMTPMVCLIDGLDEFEQDSIRWMASHLFGLYREPRMMKVRICVVSRDVLELRHAKQIMLDPDNNDKVDTDIETFTSLKMKDLTRRHDLSEDMSSQIQARLLRKAEGTFLWIGYAVSELLTKSTTVQVLDALEELPAALPALYSRMIRTIAADKLQICTSILSWVALAESPLTVNELADAVGWHVPSQLTSEQAAQDHISLCKSLVSVQRRRVVLVHQSVKDYLLRPQPDDDRLVESVRTKIAEGHLAIADRCLKVIGGHSALASYANDFWPKHAKQCGRLASSWIADNGHFFGERSESRKHWWQNCAVISLRNRPGVRRGEPLYPPNLHIACFIGFMQWVKDILTSKSRFLNPWRRSQHRCGKKLATPLHYAVWGYKLEAMEYLLKKRADMNGVGRRWASAFEHAMWKFPGSCAILECMLAHGADVNRILVKAIFQSDADLLEFAIKQNASLNSPIIIDRWFGNNTTSLHLALASGNRDASMIKRLLEAGADPLIEDGMGETALQLVRASTMLEEADGRLTFHADGRVTSHADSLRAVTDMFKELGYFDD